MKYQDVFLKQARMDEHLKARVDSLYEYAATMILLMDADTRMSKEQKVAIIGGALATPADIEMFNYLTAVPSATGKGYMYNTVDIRDALEEMRKNKIPCGVSKKRKQMVNDWFKAKTSMEYGEEWFKHQLTKYGGNTLRTLYDICHTNPHKDVAEPWMVTCVYGDRDTKGNAIEAPEWLRELRAIKKLPKHEQEKAVAKISGSAHHYVSKRIDISSKGSKEVSVAMAKKMELAQLVRRRKTFGHPDVDQVLLDRLTVAKHPVRINFLELADMIRYFDARLGTISAHHRVNAELKVELERHANLILAKGMPGLEPPVFIMIDRSGSMTQCLELGSYMACLCAATNPETTKISAYDIESIWMDKMPVTLSDAFALADQFGPGGWTAPAVSLNDADIHNFEPRTIIVFTDEEENQKHRGYYFHQYLAEWVQGDLDMPRVIFVTLGTDTYMSRNFNQTFEGKCERFELDKYQTDLSVLENLFKLMVSPAVLNKLYHRAVTRTLERKEGIVEGNEPPRLHEKTYVTVAKDLQTRDKKIFSIADCIFTLSDMVMLCDDNVELRQYNRFMKIFMELEKLATAAEMEDLHSAAIGFAGEFAGNVEANKKMTSDDLSRVEVFVARWQATLK